METASGVGVGRVFEKTTFEGKISAGEAEQCLSFVAYAGDDCRLIIDPLTIHASLYLTLSKHMGRPGGHGEPITLSGKSKDGTEFSSRDMHVRGLTSGLSDVQVELGTGEASISVPRSSKAAQLDAGIKLWLRGFRSYRVNPVHSKLGIVSVQGTRESQLSDKVSGAITIQSADGQPDKSWFRDAEAMADFIWRGLQFGHGGRLHVPLIQTYCPKKIVATFYNGNGRPAHLPAVHFSEQSEFVAALVKRFESEESFPDAVWRAVGWLNNDSSIDEVRYLTLMTAIETILHNLVPEASSTLFGKLKFKPIRDALIQALKQFDLHFDDLSKLEEGIKGINRAPISRKLASVIKKYDLPAGVFNDSLVRRLNMQRNAITHEGKALKNDNLWECILLAREMIALIVFSELGYKGRYESYAGGHEQRTMV